VRIEKLVIDKNNFFNSNPQLNQWLINTRRRHRKDLEDAKRFGAGTLDEAREFLKNNERKLF
jgi:hypothetical protein